MNNRYMKPAILMAAMGAFGGAAGGGHRLQKEFGRKDDGGGGSDATLADVLKKLGKVTDDVKNFGEDVAKKMKSGETVTQELKDNTDKALSQLGDLKAQVTELEQKAAAFGKHPGEPQRLKSLGEHFVESEGAKKLSSNFKGNLRVELQKKDILNVTGTTGAGTSPANSLAGSDRVPGIIMPGLRTMTVRDLLMPGETSQNAIEYVVETGFTNSAGMVAEGATKPKSDITFNLKNQAVKTIAHIFKASRQIMDDAPQLRSYIDARARYGLQFKEEVQLLNGDGTGQNLLGLVPQAAAFAPAFTPADATAIDRVRLAILQVILAEFPATGIVLNPIDWAKIELTKDLEGRYILGNVVNGNEARMWNLPVVATQAMQANHFLTGAMALAAQIFDRMLIEVLLSTENVDDFEKNMVTLRAEERVALAVYRPQALVTGKLDAALT
jgi:HK97 family phage major capsid protein